MSEKKKDLGIFVRGPSIDEHSNVGVRFTETGEVQIGRLYDSAEHAPEHSVGLSLQHENGPVYRVVASEHSGPSMVNSDCYRSNWDTIFGKKQTVGKA